MTMTTAIQPSTEPLLLDINKAATLTGVSTSTLRHWTTDGLPFIRGGPGGKKLYCRRDIERFVESLKECAE
jgi:DNA-binding transcriptional MerR regulator